MAINISSEAESFPEVQESTVSILKSLIQSKENANEFTEKLMDAPSHLLSCVTRTPMKNYFLMLEAQLAWSMRSILEVRIEQFIM